MNAFRTYLALSLVAVITYTVLVGQTFGWNLLPPFFTAIVDMTWQGQFNVDFTSFLALSALWVSWRHHFSPAGLALGFIAFFGGMVFLASYLIWQIRATDARMEAVLLGEARTIRLKENK